MHDDMIRHEARALVAAGLNDAGVGRRLGLSRWTVRNWSTPRHVRSTPPPVRWQRCWGRAPAVRFSDEDYAELLGLYLGDGHIGHMPRTQRLRMFLDARHPGVVADAEALLRGVFPYNQVGRLVSERGRMVVLRVHHGHLACLVPQHGPGKKHERPIVLEPWQEAILARAPWPFIRGCIRSDGCVFINRTGRYGYRSYCFDNRSTDILRLFAGACDSVGVRYRTNGTSIRIYRRASVALMLDHVGLKS